MKVPVYVYIVTRTDHFDSTVILGVCSTQEKAETIKSFYEYEDSISQFSIDEKIVDSIEAAIIADLEEQVKELKEKIALLDKLKGLA